LDLYERVSNVGTPYMASVYVYILYNSKIDFLKIYILKIFYISSIIQVNKRAFKGREI